MKARILFLAAALTLAALPVRAQRTLSAEMIAQAFEADAAALEAWAAALEAEAAEARKAEAFALADAAALEAWAKALEVEAEACDLQRRVCDRIHNDDARQWASGAREDALKARENASKTRQWVSGAREDASKAREDPLKGGCPENCVI